MNNLPTITNRTFGIEMEFEGADIRDVASTLNQVVECHFEGYTHRTTDHWKIVTDGSLPNYQNCGEIVSPVLQGYEGVAELKKVCDVLDTIEGIRVTRRCGLHVHLGADDLTVANIQTIYERYADYESQIDMVMPRSRRGRTRWCDTIKDNKNRVKRATTKRRLSSTCDRYYKVNLESLARYGTIEFRQHSGTLNFTKIVNWLSFLQAFVEKSTALTQVGRPSTNRNRPYNQIRTLFENNGYDIEYNRRRNGWVVSKDDSPIIILSNNYLNEFYTGSRENTLDRDQFFSDLSVRWYERTDYSQLEQDWDTRRTVVVEQNQEQDTGWLDGVDSKVKLYFAEREDELN